MFWTKSSLKECHTHSCHKNGEGPKASSHRSVTSSIHRISTLHGMDNLFCPAPQQKKQAVWSCVGSVFDKKHLMNNLNFPTNGQDALMIRCNNHTMLHVNRTFIETPWPHLISHRNHDLILPHKWGQLNPIGIRETKTFSWRSDQHNIAIHTHISIKPYINIVIYVHMHIHHIHSVPINIYTYTYTVSVNLLTYVLPLYWLIHRNWNP